MTFLGPSSSVLASGVAAGLFLLLAWRFEAARGRSIWRRGVVAVIAACLFMLAAQPAIKVALQAGEAILVTPGTEMEALLALDGGIKKYALPGVLPGAEGAEPVIDLGLLVRRLPEVQRWQVMGTGLESWQLEHLPGEVSFVAAEPRWGIDRAAWRRELTLGESLAVRGAVSLAQEVEGTLRLIGPAGVEDEITLLGTSSYRLRATPRQAGRSLYGLELSTAEGVVAAETVDVDVVKPKPPRILWLEGAPSFESREVKNWLRDLGGEFSLRSQISRGRYRYEFLNRERVDMARLRPSALAGSDLLAIDGPAWRGLSGVERQSIDEAVADGLGLLLLPPLPRLTGRGAPPSPFAVEGVGDLETIEIEGLGPGLDPLAPLLVTARQFSERAGQRVLLRDGAGRALAVTSPRGSGQIAATLMEGTHRWPLRGAAKSHRRYWSHLIDSLARSSSSAHIGLPVGPVIVDRPTMIGLQSGKLQGGQEDTAVLTEPDGSTVALAPAQDRFEPRRWQARLWPRQAGWHSISWGEASTAFFVAEPSAWVSWRERTAHTATLLRAGLGTAQPVVEEREPGTQDKPLPGFPFFAVLLLAWGVLWGDEQWRGASGD